MDYKDYCRGVYRAYYSRREWGNGLYGLLLGGGNGGMDFRDYIGFRA